jgi:D-alanine--poly(phosphoribitol) ligase subunit 1
MELRNPSPCQFKTVTYLRESPYFNDPDRTSQSFMQNPTHNRFCDVGYRTGDLVCRDDTGRLHFKGRTDFQIKHMGYRIELEEIEAALATLPFVKECAVIYLKIAEGMGQLLGYVAVADGADPQVDFVASVAEIVPSYMVPRRIEIRPHLPKNANGKIDRVELQQQVA